MNFRRILSLAVIGILGILLNGCGDSQKHIPEDPGIKVCQIEEIVWEIQFSDGYYTLLITENEPNIYDRAFINKIYQQYKERKTTPKEEWEIISYIYVSNDYRYNMYVVVSQKGICFYKSEYERTKERVKKTVETVWETYMK